MNLVKLGLFAFFEVLFQQNQVFFDNALDQLAVRLGNGAEIGVAAVMFQHFHHVLCAVGGQVKDDSPEAGADFIHQTRQIDVIGINLVDDYHGAKLALLCPTHHPLGH